MEKQPYPVIDERVLEPLPPKRLFSRNRGRTRAEVPFVPAGHQLVYRTRNLYVLDTTDLPLDSPTVVEASHVSLVDVTADTEVVAEIVIPSRDAANFTLRVAFLCTVTDPVAVVRTGGSDAAAMLAGYLKGHQRIFQLGLDYDLKDINDLRRKLDAQIRAYHTIEPPDFSGLAVTLASVEVMTPTQVAELVAKLREAQQTHTVKTTQLTHDHRLDELELDHRRTRERQDTEHTRSLDAMRREHARDELRKTSEAVGADPVAAIYLAHAAGELNAREVADQLRLLREREIEQDREDLRLAVDHERTQERLRWEAERADALHRQKTELRREVWSREDRRWEIEAEAKRLDAQRVFAHEESRARWEAERADVRREEEWKREDRLLENEAVMKTLRARTEVIQELARHGHLDTANLGPGLDRLITDLLVGAAPALGASEDRAIAPTEPEAPATPTPSGPGAGPGPSSGTGPGPGPGPADADFVDDDRNTKVEA
ncbi:hypothetical protein [Saccharothrix hoggarensis]|uniref:SPFH domain/Band 7 family protein n=1 Tax=Saccharothrix hoggarensis TaxID=913853 RepID=A0ABW3QYS4_9PSEU